MYNQLQLREIFHLEFLRWLARKIKSNCFALKGGVNMRFFFKSFRYSEDMDIDALAIRKDILRDTVMQILESLSFQNTLKPFGIERIVPPDIARAKQTETTQRFKAHLITSAGEDLFTKIEFSRRGFKGRIIVEPVLDDIVRTYRIPPLVVPHYDVYSALEQKINALNQRTITQARDIFDLYILSSQYKPEKGKSVGIDSSKLTKINEKIFDISFENFRDTVLAYFSAEDQNVYNSADLWDEIKLKVADFSAELSKKNG